MMKYIIVIAFIVGSFLMLPGCQINENYSYSYQFIEGHTNTTGADVAQTPSSERGSNQITPSTQLEVPIGVN